MSAYKNLQRRVTHRGREFHFVSYEGTRADARTERPAGVATWFLVAAGKRWEAVPQVEGQDESGVDQALIGWLDRFVFG